MDPKKPAHMYVYGLFDPISEELRYIGVSRNPKSRLGKHLYDNKNRNHKACWIRKLRKEGLKPEMSLIDKVPFDDWQMWEDWYIDYFRSIGCRLTNSVSGGDAGLIFSGDVIEKIRKARLGYKNSKESRIRMSKGKKKISDETIDKILRLKQEGLNNNQIARQLDMWHTTVGKIVNKRFLYLRG